MDVFFIQYNKIALFLFTMGVGIKHWRGLVDGDFTAMELAGHCINIYKENIHYFTIISSVLYLTLIYNFFIK